MAHPENGSEQPDARDSASDVEDRARAFDARVHEQGVGALMDGSAATTVNGAIAHGPHQSAMAANAAEEQRGGQKERDREWLIRYLAAHIAWLDDKIAGIDRALSAIDRLEAELAAGTFDPNNPTDEQAALMATAGLRSEDFEGRDADEVFRERREELDRDREEYAQRRNEAEDIARDLEADVPGAADRAREFMGGANDADLRSRVGSLTQGLDQVDNETKEYAVGELGRSQQGAGLALDAIARDELTAWSPGSFARSLSESPIGAAPAGSAFRAAVQQSAPAATDSPQPDEDRAPAQRTVLRTEPL